MQLNLFLNVTKTPKNCDKAADTYPSTIKYVPDQFKTQKMCDKVLLCLILFPINIRLKKCVIKLFVKILLS